MMSPQSLRHALGHFATGVTVITTRDATRQPVGVTVNSFNSVSLDPPLVLWSLARNAYSLAAFQHHGHFAVHVLAADQQEISNRFARAGSDKFCDLELEQGLADLPLLPGCAAIFQCRTEAWHEGGDHIIMIGRILSYTCHDRHPLLFHRGRYLEHPAHQKAYV